MYPLYTPSPHVIEYARSSKSKCRNDKCGETIPKGSLRYGSNHIHPEYGLTTRWYHWHCASKALPKLAATSLGSVQGFRSLRLEDQEHVRQDVAARKISTIPSSSQTSTNLPSSSQPTSSQSHRTSPQSSPEGIKGQKRKRAQEIGSSQIRNNHMTVDEDDDYFDNSQDEAKDELYASFPSQVVGVQYYRGFVGDGEVVTLVREPHNQYDTNAIQVLNISGVQLGHLPRNVAGKLAPLIDSNQIAVEGIMLEGSLGSSKRYALSLRLNVYGSSLRRTQLENSLSWVPRPQGLPSTSQVSPRASRVGAGRKGLASRAPDEQFTNGTIETRKAVALQSLLNSLEKVDDEGRRASLLDIVCPTEDLLSMPTHPDPPSIANGQLKVDLLRHQNQALQWCIGRENPVLPQKESDKPVQFWQYKKIPQSNKSVYFNLVTHSPQEDPPELGRGGLMADAMGLGKTLTMLALIAATKANVPKNFSNATLIIVPVSVLSNWTSQIDDHFTKGVLTYHSYYHVGRSMPPEKLATYDVVITSYHVVKNDFAANGGVRSSSDVSNKKRKLEQGLFGVKWKRVILDEGHTIKNSKAKISVAVKKLDAERRWVLSGTPIVNSAKDLGSLLEFLRICRPLDNEEYFKRLIMRPIAQGEPEGAETLKALMSQICLRRTKEMQNEKGEHIVPLPPVTMTLVSVKLDEDTRKLYDQVEALSKLRFTTLMDARIQSGRSSMPTNVLGLLTRLRQLALHPELVPRDYLDQLRAMTSAADAPPPPAMPITADERIRLQKILARAIEDCEECPICFDVSSDPRITPCAHVFCRDCILEVLLRDSRCPMDRRTINNSDLIPPASPSDLSQDLLSQEVNDDGDGFISSSKIDQLIRLLQLIPRNEKSLVFSQFTSFLDKIAKALDREGIPYVRFDGRMSASKRENVLERFSQPLQESEHVTSGQGVQVGSSQGTALTTRSRRSRSKRIMSDDEDGVDGDDGFVPNDDSDPFVDDSDDEWSNKTKGKKKRPIKPKIQKDNMDIFDSPISVEGPNPVVMLISLKAGALGLNLTVANNVFLMDPWWQEGIESQAIDRCNRIGQKRPVRVYQLVAENTVEAKVLGIQERKKKLIKEALSGLKSTETQRTKKEARLQDLEELFGARQNDVPQNAT